MAATRNLKSLGMTVILLVVLFLSCFVSINVEARPLRDEKINESATDNSIKEILNVAEVLEAIKTGGPSGGGRGHESPTALTMEENKRSGPSPGQGN